MSLVDIGVAVLALSSSYWLKKRDDALRYPALQVEQASRQEPALALLALLTPVVVHTAVCVSDQESAAHLRPIRDSYRPELSF